MLLKPLTHLKISDIEVLAASQVLEGRFIEFKSEPIGRAEKQKREFLADNSAFANGAGGDLVIGVKTKGGAAHEVCGVALDNPDAEKLRLSDMIRYGLEPRLAGVEVTWLPIEGIRGVLIIRPLREVVWVILADS